MLLPKRVKYRRVHRGRMTGKALPARADIDIGARLVQHRSRVQVLDKLHHAGLVQLVLLFHTAAPQRCTGSFYYISGPLPSAIDILSKFTLFLCI